MEFRPFKGLRPDPLPVMPYLDVRSRLPFRPTSTLNEPLPNLDGELWPEEYSNNQFNKIDKALQCSPAPEQVANWHKVMFDTQILAKGSNTPWREAYKKYDTNCLKYVRTVCGYPCKFLGIGFDFTHEDVWAHLNLMLMHFQNMLDWYRSPFEGAVTRHVQLIIQSNNCPEPIRKWLVDVWKAEVRDKVSFQPMLDSALSVYVCCYKASVSLLRQLLVHGLESARGLALLHIYNLSQLEISFLASVSDKGDSRAFTVKLAIAVKTADKIPFKPLCAILKLGNQDEPVGKRLIDTTNRAIGCNDSSSSQQYIWTTTGVQSAHHQLTNFITEQEAKAKAEKQQEKEDPQKRRRVHERRATQQFHP